MHQPLLSLRAALVFLLAGLAGAGAGALTALTGAGVPQSLLYGAGVSGLAVGFFDRVIGPGHECPVTDPGAAHPESARVPSVGE
ncbi:hypothetical protein ACU686_12465 [Yinghuangia aomiensis]